MAYNAFNLTEQKNAYTRDKILSQIYAFFYLLIAL